MYTFCKYSFINKCKPIICYKTSTLMASFCGSDPSGGFESLPSVSSCSVQTCACHSKTAEEGLPACGWQMRSFLKCHWAWGADHSRLLLAFTTFFNRCSKWTSAPVFLKCTQIKRYHVLDMKSCLLPWTIICVHDCAPGN